MYLLMQTRSKEGYYTPLPLGITPSLVFQYIGIHIQFTHPKFCRSVLRSIIYFELSGPSPLGFYKLLLLVLSFRLIPKSRNFLAATLLMFSCWAVPAAMMSSASPTFHWLLHLYLLDFLWVFMPRMFLNGPIGWMPHHWSSFLSLTDCSHNAFYIPLQKNRVLQNLVVHLILPLLYLEHLSKIFLGLGNCLNETSNQVQ